MLTKEHLRLKARGANLKVDFLDSNDSEVQAKAGAIIDLLRSFKGRSLAEIEDGVSGQFKRDKIAPGFVKLVLDKSGLGDTEDFTSLRADLLSKGERLRQAGVVDYDEFRAQMEQSYDRSFDHLCSDLYGDLPQYRTLMEVPEVEATWLINRYNLAQVQGALLQCKKITLKLNQPGRDTIRTLMRRSRFHRLLIDVHSAADGLFEEGGTILEFAGPGSVISGSTAYGIRLANFFPAIVGLACDWELVADLKYKNKDRQLKLDSGMGLEGQQGKVYDRTPEELQKFMLSFNEKDCPWQAEEGADLVRVGADLCWPDVSFTSATNQVRHLEIFHKGQNRQFIRRVAAAEDANCESWYIAVAQPLADRAEIAERFQNSPWLQKYAVTFRGFPNTKKVIDLLQRC